MNQGTTGRTFFSKYTTPDWSFASALHSSMQPQEQRPQQHKKPAVHHIQQATSQASGQSVQAKNVNSNAMDDMSVTFTMVQQIMTGLSGAVSEEEKVAITKVVFSLLNLMAATVHRPLKVITFNARWGLKPGLTDRLVVGRNVTLTLSKCQQKLISGCETQMGLETRTY
jgi:hypothetical protein